MTDAINLVDQLPEIRTSLRYWLSAAALVASLLGIMYLAVQHLPRYTGRPFVYPEFYAGIGLALLAAIGAFLLARRQAATAIRARAASLDVEIYGPRTLAFDPDRVEVRFRNSGSWRTWSEFVGIAEYETLLVMWRNKTDGLIISKRAFGSAADVGAFMTAVGTWIASAKQARHV